jgi:ubiquinone/menaquinone biosynthesis C-methylase UbiE
MKVSLTKEVRDMYESTAGSYSKMMDKEIDLPVYSDILGRLHERIANVPGTLIDTACGSGHMMSMYRKRYDQRRSILGIDLSPQMVSIAGKKLGSDTQVVVGDMCDLSSVETNSASALLNFFAVHHLDPKGVRMAINEWYRALRPGGQLLVAAWEGVGTIDYGDESAIVALRYRRDDLFNWTQEAGFIISRCVVEPVEGFPMDAVYLEGAKE